MWVLYQNTKVCIMRYYTHLFLGYQESVRSAVDQIRTEVSEVAEEIKQKFNHLPEDLRERFNRLQGQFFHAVRTINGANYMYRYR